MPLPSHPETMKTEFIENISSREMQPYSNNEPVEEPQTWRSLQPGETIDEALEKAKHILENMPLSQPAETFSQLFQEPAESHQLSLMPPDAENRCTTLVPYCNSEPNSNQRHENLDSDAIIILDDSSDDGSPDPIPSAVSVSGTQNDTTVVVHNLEDSTADSEVLEVVPEKEELKPVEQQIDDDDFGKKSFKFTQLMNKFRNNWRKRRRNSLASSMRLSSSQIYKTRAARCPLRGKHAVLRQVLLFYVRQGCFRVQRMGCFSSASL